MDGGGLKRERIFQRATSGRIDMNDMNFQKIKKNKATFLFPELRVDEKQYRYSKNDTSIIFRIYYKKIKRQN